MGRRTGIEPVTWRRTACSTAELTSSRNPLLPAEAYATAAPRAPDGRWNPYRNEPEEKGSALPPDKGGNLFWAMPNVWSAYLQAADGVRLLCERRKQNAPGF